MDILPLVLPYIESDMDKLNLLMTCKYAHSLYNQVRFTGEYDYEKVKHLNFLERFNTVKYLEEIIITGPGWDSDMGSYRLRKLSDNITHMTINQYVEILPGSLPKHIK